MHKKAIKMSSRKVLHVVNPIAIQRAIEIIQNEKRLQLIVRSQTLGRRVACEVKISSFVSWVNQCGDALCEIPIVSKKGIPFTSISAENINQIIFV
jgi:hypothetical protein